MITDLKVGGKLIAYVADPAKMDGEVCAISHPSFSLQALLMRRQKGTAVAKHAHKKMKRETSDRQKAIVLMKGSMSVFVCDESGVEAPRHILKEGQCLFLVAGGYRLEMDEECVFFEFKNGPHFEDKILL